MEKNHLKIIIVLMLIAGIASYFAFGGGGYLSLESIKTQRAAFEEYYANQPLTVIAAFIGAYVLITALSLPGAAVMTLLAGALFGLVTGSIIASISSIMGATLAFLAARFLLGAAVQERYGKRLAKINEGIEREGAFYLFALRLVPVFPFFLINIAMGLTRISIWKYVVASWLGMIPGTIAFIYAGTQLAEITSLSDVLSVDLILAFVILGLLPLGLKKAVNYWRDKQGKSAL